MGETKKAMSSPPLSPPAQPTTSPAPAPPPLGSGGFLRWMWRQLTSMRIALILLFCLAVAAIPGSVLPQRGIDPVLVNAWISDAPTWGPVLDRLGFFDVYAAPWFAAIYLLLFISVIGCVLPRTMHHIRALRTNPPPAPRRLTRMKEYRQFQLATSADEVLGNVEAQLRSRRWRVSRGGDPEQGWVAAEKGYARETGNLVFHAALIVLLIAVSYGSLFGWRGNVIVREGGGFSNTLTQYDAWGAGRMVSPDALDPFSITLTDFQVEFDRDSTQRGSPLLFEADVIVAPEPGEPTFTDVIRVNEPLSLGGAKVFLVGHGYAPQVIIRDADGRVVYDDNTIVLPQDGNQTSTGVMKAPDALPQLGFQALFLPTAAVDAVRGPHSTFPDTDDPAMFISAWIGDLGLDDGIPQSVYRLETDAMTQIGLRAIRPGEVWQLPDGVGSVEFGEIQRWASFQIAHDPGKEPALIAAGAALVGLMLSLFVKRRRVWIRATTGVDGYTVVEVAALARHDETDLTDDVDAAVAAAEGRDR